MDHRHRDSRERTCLAVADQPPVLVRIRHRSRFQEVERSLPVREDRWVTHRQPRPVLRHRQERQRAELRQLPLPELPVHQPRAPRRAECQQFPRKAWVAECLPRQALMVLPPVPAEPRLFRSFQSRISNWIPQSAPNCWELLRVNEIHSLRRCPICPQKTAKMTPTNRATDT